MTLEQTACFLAGTIVAMLVAYMAVLFLWRREDKPVSGRWEIGCSIRTAHNPHHFLPGAWRVRAHYDDGTSEWERFS